MKILQHKLPPDHNLFMFGDVHSGTVLHYGKGFEQLVQMMNSPFEDLPSSANFGIDHGDIIEAITIDDPRYEPLTAGECVLQQADDAVTIRKPIAKKLITILEGNHPLKLWRFGNITEMVCRKLGVPYGTWTSKVHFLTPEGKLMYKCFCTHGRKMISSAADDPKRRLVNMRLILKRHLKFKAGDCILMSKGHTHKLLICNPETELYLTDDGEKIYQSYLHSTRAQRYIHPDHRWYVSTGSFLRLYGENISGYAEQAEYDPIELGFAVVLVRDGEIQDIRKIILQ